MTKEEMLLVYTTRYLNKKDLMFRLPSEIKIQDFWPEMESYRRELGQDIPLLDQKNNKFWFCPIPYKENLYLIDQLAQTTVSKYIADDFNQLPNLEKNLLFEALIDEAFNSSVIEGAFSTKKKTTEMISKKAAPQNISEQMIYNNYKALEYILEHLHTPLNEEMIVNIYKIITENTLEPENQVEKYRNDAVIVWDYAIQKEIYAGPDYKVVPGMMKDLIAFIHAEDNLHPLEKAGILHFYFIYIHPFFDGNGRTARAIAYAYLLQKGYDFFRFFSISTVIKEQKLKYYKAIKDVEDYGSDLTYFINFNTTMILTSLRNVLKRLGREYGRVILFEVLKKERVFLLQRQKKCLEYFIKSEKRYITIEEYMKKYKVSYETARKDLNMLEAAELFSKGKVGKKYVYEFTGLAKLGLGEFGTSSAKIGRGEG